MSSRIALCATLIAVLRLAACGGDASVVVRVGGAAIEKRSVEHWTHVIERGGAVGESAGLHGAPRQRALELLISSRWLIGQAAMMGSPVSGRAIERAVAEQRDTSGSAEFGQQLRATGETVEDVKLEVTRELASAAIRRVLAARAARASDAEIAAFYKANRRQFTVHEFRTVDLVENLPSRAAALALLRRVGSGPRFTKMSYHEALERGKTGLAGVLGKAALVRAIFSARVGAVSRPMPLGDGWTVFVVRRIRPVRIESLEEARATILENLAPKRLQRIRREFIAAYQASWRPKTDCRAGYVVPGCVQDRGELDPEAAGLGASR